MDDLMKAEQDECEVILKQLEVAVIDGLNRVPIPEGWATVGRFFAISAMLRLSCELMIGALTNDPDPRHHQRYLDMLCEVERRISPWSGVQTHERTH